MASQKAPSSNGRLGSKKVKTGCLTCKIRRVKCDEAKPACRRCTSTGRRCDGYRSSIPMLGNQHEWVQKHAEPSVIIVSPERALVCLQATEQEQRSFEYYRHRTASSLAHTLESTFWTDFILQVSYSEPAVRHALIAIGALNERLRPSNDDGLIPRDQDRNLKLALGSYNRAIQHLKVQMQQTDSSLIAILTCILFVCVEFLQDNITQAITLIHQGCAILQSQEKVVLDEKQSDYKSHTTQLMIDQQVMPMFSRLTVLSALCGRPTLTRPFIDPGKSDPLSFVDLRGARSSLHILMDQGHATIRQAESCKWLHDGENNAPESLRFEQSKISHQLNQWQIDFTRLQDTLELSKNFRQIQAVSLLSMYFTTASIWLSACLEKAQEVYDSYEESFRKIVEAAELVVNLFQEQPQSEILFTFEMGLVPPLYFTATKCRYPGLRRRAVSLILRAPGKEGMWDREEMAQTARKVIRMEEGGKFEEEDVLMLPHEAARLHDVRFEREDARPGQRKTVIKYMSKPYGLDGPWHMSEEYFNV